VDLLEAAPPGPALAAAYTWLAYMRMLVRDIPGAIEAGGRGIELAERFGEHDLDANRRYASAWLARCHFEQGRWSEAGTTVASLVAEGLAMPPSRIVALTVLGRLRTRRGDPDARAPLEEAWELATQTGDLRRIWPVAAGQAEQAWLDGRPAAVPGLVAGPFELARRLGHEWAVGELGFWLWRVGGRPDPPAGAASPWAWQMAGDWRAGGRGVAGAGLPV
jgi:hypothetical protein